MKVSRSNNKQPIDYSSLIAGFIEQYDLVHIAEIDDTLFIYRPLGRAEYKSILTNPNMSQWEKEDGICNKVLLWPENFDFDNCLAGVPTKLCQQILENSFLSGTEDIITLLEMFRDECDEIDSQMCCIISECFPSYKVEEIESWDMMKFTKIYSKAEWIMKNIRQMDLNTDIVEFLKESSGNNQEEIPENIKQEEYSNNTYVEEEQEPKNNNVYKIGVKEVTKEEYEQYEALKREFPDFITWDEDAIVTGNYSTQQTTPPALRPGSW